MNKFRRKIMQQLQYDYICQRCGRRLVPEGECGDETAPILFDLSEALGIADSDTAMRRIPAFLTARELRGIVEDPESDGTSFMKASLDFDVFMKIIAARSEVAELGTITADEMRKYLETRSFSRGSESVSDEFDYGEEQSTEETQTKDDAESDRRIEDAILKCGASDVVGDFDRGLIDKFCQIILNLFFDANYELIPYTFQIKVNLSAMGKPRTKLGYTYKINGGEEQFPMVSVICGEPGCWRGGHNDGGAPVPSMAWQSEHIAIGFIGAAGSGKTCLITSLLSKLLSNGKLVGGDRRDEIHNCIKAYESNRELPKTEKQGKNSFNATVACGDKLVTLVDISGECFDMESGGFDRNTANKHFKMIRICKCYVLCLDPKNEVYNGNGLAAQSIGEFIEYLKTRDRCYAAPILLTLTKCDSEEGDSENYDVSAEEGTVEAETRIMEFFSKSSKEIERDYPQFFSNVSNDAYMSCALSSAYGCAPKPDERNLRTLMNLREKFKGKYIYLTNDGHYYVCAEHDRRDYPVPKNLNSQICVVKRSEGVTSYIFDPTVEERSEGEVRNLTELRFTTDEAETRDSSGMIFDGSIFADSPNPLNIGVILEWLLRVCGVHPIKYLEFDEERGRNRVCEYDLRSGDRWSRDESKVTKPELARSVTALFLNPTRLDSWTSEHEHNTGSRMLMAVLDKVGFTQVKNRLLDTTKDWREN